MNNNAYNTPRETTKLIIESGCTKALLSIPHMIFLSFIAGVFTAFAAEGSTMAAYNLLSNPDTYGLGRVLSGAIFGTGLMIVIITGGELFNGNNLMIVGLLNKNYSFKSMIKNWIFVYIGNFLGSVFIAYLMYHSKLFNHSNGLLGGMTIRIAVNKINLSFLSALYLGIMCNILICSAVLMAMAAKDITGKLFSCFFPIWLFITSGFENSIANMYYIPAGILSKNDLFYVKASEISPTTLDSLNWSTMVINNLIPVTIGNIIGGSFFIGILYWYVHSNGGKNEC
ncbi:MAG: formate/nitrite transporter family protein [Filifactoraceae bacterium]